MPIMRTERSLVRPPADRPAPMRAVVLADTHVRDGDTTRLPQRAWDELHRADVILHAGDVTGAAFLSQLRAVAPVYAVLGNNDGALAGTLPATVEVELASVAV